MKKGRKPTLCARANIAAQGGVTLKECFPQIMPYWHWKLNSISPDEVAVNSEKTYIFLLPDGRAVPIKIINLTSNLRKYARANIEQYLNKAYRKFLNKMQMSAKEEMSL